MRIGEILTFNTWISEEQLQKGLKIQKKQGGKLGAILVALDYITPNQLTITLFKQRKTRLEQLISSYPDENENI